MKWISGNIWLIVLIAISASFLVPTLGSYLSPYLAPLLMALMYFSTLPIRLKKVHANLYELEKTTGALLIVHLASPILIFFLKDLLPQPIYVGLIIASVSSAGISIVFLSTIFGGIPGRALVITALSTLASPLSIPFLVYLFAGAKVEVAIGTMMTTIAKLVILPFGLAWLTRRTPLYKPFKKISVTSSIIILFLLIIGIMSPVISVVLQNIQLSITLGLIVTVVLIINFALGFSIGKNTSEHITYAISTSYKNYALSTVLALSLFDPMVALPSVIYTVISNLLLVPLQFAVKRSEVKKSTG